MMAALLMAETSAVRGDCGCYCITPGGGKKDKGKDYDEAFNRLIGKSRDEVLLALGPPSRQGLVARMEVYTYVRPASCYYRRGDDPCASREGRTAPLEMLHCYFENGRMTGWERQEL